MKNNPRKFSAKNILKAALMLAALGVILFIAINIPYVSTWLGVSSSLKNPSPQDTINCSDDIDFSVYQELCELSELNNQGRRDYIETWLNANNIEHSKLAIEGTDSMADFVVAFPGGNADDNNCTIFTAHYDKAPFNQDSQAALDNTAGVYSLMKLTKKLDYGLRIDRLPSNCAIIVFSGEEETGWGGAWTFVTWIRASSNTLDIQDVIVVDSIGRGNLYVGATGNGTGIYFNTFTGERATNLHQVYKGADYKQVNKVVAEKLKDAGKRAEHKIRVYPKIVGWSEDEYYYKAGYDVVRVYGDDFKYYFNNIDTMDDKVENLDKQSVDAATEVWWEYLNEE